MCGRRVFEPVHCLQGKASVYCYKSDPANNGRSAANPKARRTNVEQGGEAESPIK